MTQLELKIIDETSNSTISELKSVRYEFPESSQLLCFVVEDGFRLKKEYGKTRITGGKYKLIKRQFGGFYNRYKKRFNQSFVLQLQNVPQFSDILIHIGNTVADTKGCLLLNDGIVKGSDGNYRGVKSTQAYLRVYDWIAERLEHGEVWINIIR